MAENLTQVNSYQDKLLEAMSIVSSQLISSIPYDKTVTCTIVSDKFKAEGKYKVTNGDATFDAYSSDTKLKVDDVVYVTIPEGNYDNQKIIQGKKTSKEEKPFVFTTPFDTILDLTDNLIANEGHVIETKSSLIANNGYITEKIKETVNGQEIEKEVIKIEKAQFKPICHLKNLNLTGYSRLGLKADFMSWIPNAVKGSYGLRVTVIDNLNTTTTDDKQVTSVQQTKIMLLDVSDMYGSPYNFESYYSQEKVFPITELNTITDIIIEFYQIAGSFYDIDNNILTLQDATIDKTIENQQTYFTEYGENLFVDNVYVSLGYDVSEITDEYIVPVINDSMTYSNYRENDLNKKRINLRWVHQFEDGPRVVKETDFTQRLQNCEIAWYRYHLGAAASDAYCGVYWKRLSVDENGNLTDYDGKIKVIPEDIVQEDGSVTTVNKEYPDYGLGLQELLLTFSPDTSFQTEQIKCIIYLNDNIIRGPVITFTNEESVAGQQASNFINALEIECVDGTAGNYLLYLENGSILNMSDSQEVRKLKCNFAETGTVAKSELLLDSEKGDYITWKIPIKNSMFLLSGYAMNKDTKAYTYTINKKNSATGEIIESKSYNISDSELEPVYIKGNYIIIQGEAAFDKNTNTILYPSYKISALYSMYNMNNTIACTVQKDRVIYTTELDFTFGVAGTMGTDKSLVIDFVNGQTAVIANDTSTAYQLEVKMYDEKNQPVNLSGISISWSWYGGPGLDDIDNATRNLQFITTNTSVVALKNNGISIGNANDIYIAKVTVGEDGAELEAYFPIPIKSAEEYSHIEGATQVIYLSNGEPEFYKGEYKLYKTIDDKIGEAATEVVPDTIWSRISQETGKFIGDVVKQSVDSKKYILKPIGVYTSEVKNYAALCKINGITVWQQPILVLQNKYPSRIINKWDGKTLTMDEESGIILNTALASGRKESDNTFSGVMLGDWSGSGGKNNVADRSLTDCTGIYGFNHGAMAYAFKDDGTAFIGKDGLGRIEFNGTSGTISGGFNTNRKNPNMIINLSNGQINAEHFTLKAGDLDDTQFIVLNTESSTLLPQIGQKPPSHGNYPFEIGKFFKADYTGKIYAEEGTLGAWRFSSTKQGTGDEYKSAGSLYSGYGGSYSDIVLDPLRNTITGGRFRASVLEALQGNIKLSGFLTVYNDDETYFANHKYPDDTEVNELQYNTNNIGGKLGFMKADFGGEIEPDNSSDSAVKNAGIGMSCGGKGIVKATTLNAGMSFGSYYLSLQQKKAVMRGTIARLILQDSTIEGDANPAPHAGLGYGSSYLSCASTESVLAAPTNIELVSSTIWSNGNLTVGKSEEGQAKNAHISGTLTVGTEAMNATSTLNGNLTVTTGGIGITGNSYFKDILGIGYSYAPNTEYILNVNGNSNFNGNITVSGISQFQGNIIASGTLSVTGQITSNSNLTAKGTVDFNGAGTQKGIRAQFA